MTSMVCMACMRACVVYGMYDVWMVPIIGVVCKRFVTTCA